MGVVSVEELPRTEALKSPPPDPKSAGTGVVAWAERSDPLAESDDELDVVVAVAGGSAISPGFSLPNALPVEEVESFRAVQVVPPSAVEIMSPLPLTMMTSLASS